MARRGSRQAAIARSLDVNYPVEAGLDPSPSGNRATGHAAGAARWEPMAEREATRSMAGRKGPGKGEDGEGQTGLVTKTRPKTKKPSLYKVLLLNDDYTPMEFVVQILERFFGKGREDATRIMLDVHREGVGICGAYAHEVADAKVWQVIEYSRQNQHPLQCTMEKE